MKAALNEIAKFLVDKRVDLTLQIERMVSFTALDIAEDFGNTKNEDLYRIGRRKLVLKLCSTVTHYRYHFN